MDEQELKKLAIDIAENKVFGTFNLDSHNFSIVGSVFMPLVFMSDKDLNELKTYAHIYEYLHAAGPITINGFPMFFSMRVISQEDWAKVFDYLTAYEKQKAEFLKKEPKKISDSDP